MRGTIAYALILRAATRTERLIHNQTCRNLLRVGPLHSCCLMICVATQIQILDPTTPKPPLPRTFPVGFLRPPQTYPETSRQALTAWVPSFVSLVPVVSAEIVDAEACTVTLTGVFSRSPQGAAGRRTVTCRSSHGTQAANRTCQRRCSISYASESGCVYIGSTLLSSLLVIAGLPQDDFRALAERRCGLGRAHTHWH